MADIERITNKIKSYLFFKDNPLIDIFLKDLEEIQKKYIKKTISNPSQENELHTAFLREVEDLRSFIFDINTDTGIVSTNISNSNNIPIKATDYISFISKLKSQKVPKIDTSINNDTPLKFKLYLEKLKTDIINTRKILQDIKTEEQKFIKEIIDSIQYEDCNKSVFTNIQKVQTEVFDNEINLEKTINLVKNFGGSNNLLTIFSDNYQARELEEKLSKQIFDINKKINDINKFNLFLEKCIIYNNNYRSYSIISLNDIKYYYNKLNTSNNLLLSEHNFLLKLSIIVFTEVIKHNKCIKIIEGTASFNFFTLFFSFFIKILDIIH